jgi:hypothetical protein
MNLVHAASRSFNRARLRVGFTLGLGLALVILAVGTATAAVTQFQKVIIVNAAESPVPVIGTVSVSNLPGTQDVEVTNFPETQAVSGTVNVGNFPAGPLATRRETAELTPAGFVGGSSFFGFAQMNVTSVIVADGDEDNYNIGIGGFPLVVDHEGNFREQFTAAFPASGLNITCLNALLDCDVTVTVLGY